MSGQKRKLSSRNTTGYTGVSKTTRGGKKFRARITIDKREKSIGLYVSAKAAALAFDRAAVQQKFPSSRLNFPDGLPSDDEDIDDIMKSEKKRVGRSQTNITGYKGVAKSGKRYMARIRIDQKQRSLGTYDTPKEAALAYDRAVIQHKRPSSKLNFPHDDTTSSQDNESREEDNEAIGSDDDDDDDGSEDDDDALAFPRVPHLFKHDPIS